jgi:short-subunit dehydrogenase
MTYQRVMDVNFFGVLRMTKKFLPMIKQHKGRIITVGSFLGRSSPYSLSAYTASKFALVALHESLRQEMRTWKVHVALIEPGTMKTNMMNTVYTTMHKHWETCTDATVKSVYSRKIVQEHLLPRIQLIMNVFSQSVDHTVNAIIHSIDSTSPFTRYFCGIDSILSAIAAILPLPSVVFDPLLLSLIGAPTEGES